MNRWRGGGGQVEKRMETVVRKISQEAVGASRHWWGEEGDPTSSAFLISSQPPNPQVPRHHQSSWKDLFNTGEVRWYHHPAIKGILGLATIVTTVIITLESPGHDSLLASLNSLLLPTPSLHWYCHQLLFFSPHNCSLYIVHIMYTVHCTQLHPSKLARFAHCKTCPFLWNHEVKWTESLCMLLCVESDVWRAWHGMAWHGMSCRDWQICASRSRSWLEWLLCKSSN